MTPSTISSSSILRYQRCHQMCLTIAESRKRSEYRPRSVISFLRALDKIISPERKNNNKKKSDISKLITLRVRNLRMFQIHIRLSFRSSMHIL